MTITYRLLLPDEYSKLHAIMPSEFVPHPETSAVAVAEDDDGNLQGVLVLQLQWHMEPLVLKSPHVNFARLKTILDNQLKDFPSVCYYALIDSEHVARMAEKVGMKPEAKLVFRGGGA